jgi:hypothetical protein
LYMYRGLLFIDIFRENIIILQEYIMKINM